MLPFVLIVSTSASHAGDKLFKVVKDRYAFVMETNYITFDGCDHDKKYDIGSYNFVCSEYGYTYSYGTAIIMAKKISYKGSDLNLVKMCVDDGKECFSGRIEGK
jgi:hypothetical protein